MCYADKPKTMRRAIEGKVFYSKQPTNALLSHGEAQLVSRLGNYQRKRHNNEPTPT
jgi:hypothetical protein